MATRKVIRYRDAGVSIDEATSALPRIKSLAKATFTPGVLSAIGSFGAGYALEGYKKPVLVSSADGVGTKLRVAILMDKHDTIGEDLVNHCVNDIAVQNAKPLFFLDYFAAGRLSARILKEVIEGLARGCQRNRCALIGGETAEMPGLYQGADYDLAGFIVGCVERSQLLTGSSIAEGDLLLGLPSTGLHTNGYSLARKLLFERGGYKVTSRVPDLGCTVGEELLKVHRSYSQAIFALGEKGILKGAAHITGGGITDNTPRILPKGLAARINTSAWEIPAVFEFLRRLGNVPLDDYRRTFNLGIGMILVVSPRHLERAAAILKKQREQFFRLGEVVAQPRGAPGVIYQ